MAKIKLTSGYTVIPEGTHVFQIASVDYKEDFGKLEITMNTQDGTVHKERFSFLKNDGSENTGAFNAFSYFAKTCLNDFSRNDVDPEELVGCFIECDVTHDKVESKNKPGTFNTYARLGDKRVSDGWSTDNGAEKSAVDLSSLLG